MKRIWSPEELSEQWSVGAEEREKLPDKAASGRLGFIAQLAFHRLYGRFPEGRGDFAPLVLAHLAELLDVSDSAIADYDWDGRTGRRHRGIVLEYLGIQAFDAATESAFRAWLTEEVLPNDPSADEVQESIERWFVGKKRKWPGRYRLDRIINSTRQNYDERLFQTVMERLDPQMRRNLDALLEESDEEAALLRLRSDPGRVGLESVLEEAKKLECLRALELPSG